MVTQASQAVKRKASQAVKNLGLGWQQRSQESGFFNLPCLTLTQNIRTALLNDAGRPAGVKGGGRQTMDLLFGSGLESTAKPGLEASEALGHRMPGKQQRLSSLLAGILGGGGAKISAGRREIFHSSGHLMPGLVCGRDWRSSGTELLCCKPRNAKLAAFHTRVSLG